VAFVENWQPCPSLEKIAQYSKVVVAFAVSYTWNPSKNQCSPTCTIGSPIPICNNVDRPDLIEQWKAAGVTVLLSFGGAGMGGSWAGDVNDCWEHCFDRVDSVVSQLTNIVAAQGFDGIDLDYEYFLTERSSSFLEDLTIKLRAALGSDKIISHAPMDSDLDAGDAYYNVLKNVAHSVDYLLPQYYNGFLRPASDMLPVLSHFSDLVHGLFNGDESKVIFGFCISVCPGFNVNSAEAVQILDALNGEFPNHGGAFFWAASHDIQGDWSRQVVPILERR
jgi:hypothetical protein